EVVQYDPESGDVGLFNEYINFFLKMKAEASGYPRGVVTEEEKDAYIKRYHDKEGVLLDKAKIQVNPGLRQLAKLMLNSFWGKYGQRSNLPQVEYVSNRDELNSALTDET